MFLQVVIPLLLAIGTTYQAWRSPATSYQHWAFVAAALAFGLLAMLNLAAILGYTGWWSLPLLLTAVFLIMNGLFVLVRGWVSQQQDKGTMCPRLTPKILLALELSALTLWTLVFTIPYLDMDPMIIPAGEEYLAAIQSHHLWTRVQTCGWCGWWNDGVRGGAPSNVDVYGAMLHPLVIITNLLWGVRNGTEIALAASFLLGGLAQWWLATVLGVGRIARLWSAAMAVVAGHLAGRIELGTFGLVLSTAACALVLPPLIQVIQTQQKRAAVALGVMLGLAALSGQGYIQVGVLWMLPALLFLLPYHNLTQLWCIGKRLVLAAVLAGLLAAPFLIPFGHFLPEFAKHTVPTLRGQPFTYLLFNLVVHEPDFFYEHSVALNKHIHPWLYINFIGWVPLLLVFFAMASAKFGAQLRLKLMLLAMALLVLWGASDGPMEFLARLAPESLATSLRSMRYYSVIAGLAIPPLLGLAAMGLDWLIQHPLWQRVRFIEARFLLLVPLLWALATGWSFGRHWMAVKPIDTDVYPVLQSLQTQTRQWVNTPHGQFRFVEPAVGMGLKVANGIRPWMWKGRNDPTPFLWVNHAGHDPPAEMTPYDMVEGFARYLGGPEQSYARVEHPDKTLTLCEATGVGGHIDVHCATKQAGQLVVKENTWTGWEAAIDGQSVPLRESRWLSVLVPTGKHTITFRYRPWDVPLGLGLCCVGIVLAMVVWWRGEQ